MHPGLCHVLVLTVAQALARYSAIRQESVRSALDTISRYERSYAALRDCAGVAFVDCRDLTEVQGERKQILQGCDDT